jgi:hypothetical protein
MGKMNVSIASPEQKQSQRSRRNARYDESSSEVVFTAELTKRRGRSKKAEADQEDEDESIEQKTTKGRAKKNHSTASLDEKDDAELELKKSRGRHKKGQVTATPEKDDELVAEPEPKKSLSRPPRPKKDLVAATFTSVAAAASRSTRSRQSKEDHLQSPVPTRRSGRQRKPKMLDYENDEFFQHQTSASKGGEETYVSRTKKGSTRGKQRVKKEEREQSVATRATRSRRKVGGDDESVASEVTTASTRSLRSASKRKER